MPKSTPESLLRIARTYGTPAYAYDLDALRLRIARLLQSFPAKRIRYSLKANPSPALCSIIAAAGLQADVSSATELATALKAGFGPSKINLSGPYKSPELLDRVVRAGPVTLSIDSVSELEQLAGKGHRSRIILRLKQGIEGDAVERFGIDVCDLPDCRELLDWFEFIGFHMYSRSQILQPDIVIENLRRALDFARQAADILGTRPGLINFGAGLGVPYKVQDAPLDFETLAAEIKRVSALSCAPLILELGRFVVAEAGWYLTKVVGHQRRGSLEAIVVDGGTHQRSDLCGIGLRSGCRAPTVLSNAGTPSQWTSILGSLCLPSDILADRVLLPPLELGDILAFPNAGAYGATASPRDFLGHAHPLEASFEGDRISPLHELTSAPTLHGNSAPVAL